MPAGSSIELIFHAALGHKDAARRQAYLDDACRGNAILQQQVAALLRAHEQAGNFLGETAAEAASASLMGSTLVVESGASPPGSVVPPQIPGFRVERKLGEGGLGAVFLAYDEQLERTVAVKVLAGAESAAVRQRVFQEARRAASLGDPAIVTIYSVQEETPAIVMEWVEGYPIDRAAAGLTFPQKARLLQEVARALAVAHQHGIIHRDLKPENVLVTPELQPKVLDFGLAISLEEASAGGRLFEGTPRYASPEQIRRQPLNPASDIFSFGSLMFKVLTGCHAFDGEDLREIFAAICTADPPFLRDVAIGVPEELQAICLACLSSNAAQRPAAREVALDLGRYLAGEPVRLRPALYGDILRRRVAEHSAELGHWERQGMISSDERDRLQTVHRRMLADEDHWIIDPRRISLGQTILYTSTWLVVVGAALFVWLASGEVSPPMSWLAPLLAAGWLLIAGVFAARRREPLASAAFLAAGVLACVPATLAILRDAGWLSHPVAGVRQLFGANFTNEQTLAALLVALGFSLVTWSRLRMTGFAWTTAALASLNYIAVLLCFNWLDQKPEIKALWCLPLVAFDLVGLWSEKTGQVRWAIPFHLVGFVALVGVLDMLALHGPTLAMIGLTGEQLPWFDPERQKYLSFAANGFLFLWLMLLTERAPSLDLRLASRWFEPLALLHILAPLYANARAHRQDSTVLFDVLLYAGSVLLLLLLGPWRSRWRMFVGALGGVALGSHLLIDFDLVPKPAFTLTLSLLGLVSSAAIYLYLQRPPGGGK